MYPEFTYADPVEGGAADRFLRALEDLCEEHDMRISHEDGQGRFQLSRPNRDLLEAPGVAAFWATDEKLVDES